jgi:hypothetical protein
MGKVLLAMTVALGLGCSDHNIEIAKQLMQKDPAGGPPSVLVVAGCEKYGSMAMDRACVVDSDGQSFGQASAASSGSMVITSADPPYGAYLVFDRRLTPLAEDISTEGPDASVQVFAAPYNVLGSPCCSEEDPANRVAARASLTDEGGLLVTVHESVPPGTQIAIILTYSSLFRGLVTPTDGSACHMPMGFCTQTANMGWATRFYVGATPALSAAGDTKPYSSPIGTQK